MAMPATGTIFTGIQDLLEAAGDLKKKKCANMIIKKKIQLILSILSLLNAISLFGLNALWMSALFLVLSCILLNLSRPSPLRVLKKLALVTCLIGMIIAAPITLNQLSKGLFDIGSQALKKGPESLSYHTRFSLWWSAVWLSIGGIGYLVPYTVAEQVSMFWPGKKERLWNSNFPSKQRKLRTILRMQKGEQIKIMESINIHLFGEVIVKITVMLAWH